MVHTVESPLGSETDTTEWKLPLKDNKSWVIRKEIWRPESNFAALGMTICVSPEAHPCHVRLSKLIHITWNWQVHWNFSPFSKSYEGERSSCKWWYKVLPAPNCHPTVYETHPWQRIPLTSVQLCLAVTSCSEPNCNWCQLTVGSRHRFCNRSVMSSAKYCFLLF